MTYASTNLRAASNPLRSIPLFRPIGVLGQAFSQAYVPDDHARALVAQKLEQAREEIELAWEAYSEAKVALSEANQMRCKDRHDAEVYSDRAVARRISGAFGILNRRRARFLLAQKALLAAEASVLAL